MTTDYLTIKEVAAKLRVDHRTIRKLVRKGDLRAVKVAGVYRIGRDDLRDYLDRAAIKKPSAVKPTASRVVRKVGGVKDYFA